MSDNIDEKLVAELVDKRLKEEHSGLISNRDEILIEKREAENRLKELENQLSKYKNFTDDDILRYNELREKEKKNQLVSKGSSQELAELQIQIDNLEKDKLSVQNSLQEALDGKQSVINQLHKLNRDNSITKALDSVNVHPDSKELLLSHFISKSEVRDDNGKVNVFITGDDGIQKSPDEFIELWSKSDQAKRHLLAPNNSGASFEDKKIAVGPSAPPIIPIAAAC